MGSGPEAGLESEAAIELIEKFNEGGFSEATTLNAVNSIMGRDLVKMKNLLH